MKPAEEAHQDGKPTWEERILITRKEWDDAPGTCAAKFGLLTVAILAMGHLAPLVAIGAGLVIVGKAVRS